MRTIYTFYAWSVFQLEVMAVDGGKPSLESNVSRVLVDVQRNLHTPHWTLAPEVATTDERTGVGNRVTSLSAEDADSDASFFNPPQS